MPSKVSKVIMEGSASEKYEKIRRQRNKSRAGVAAAVIGCLLLAVVILLSDKDGSSSSSLVFENGLRSAKPPPPVESVATEGDVLKMVNILDADVRKIKQTGVIMEKDPKSQDAIRKLQEATKTLLALRYGPKEPYRVEVTLQFQKSIPDFESKGAEGSILLEMAPSKLVPHSVFSFLEIARQWQGGAFHRIAGHVLQVMVNGHFRHLAFQEYSPEWPHRKGTVGYAGRPSGPAWYVSTVDNTRNHGPGSQQDHNPYEADSCFGKVIRGFEEEVQRIASIPDKGFLNDPKKHVLIKSMKILVPGSGPNAVDGYVEWKGDKSAPAM